MTTKTFLIILFALVLPFHQACGTPQIAEVEAVWAKRNLKVLPGERETVFVGQKVRIVVMTEAPHEQVAAVTAVKLPDGASLEDRGDGTAVFSWIPALDQVGTHEVEVGATAAGKSVSSKWQLDVVLERELEWDGEAEVAAGVATGQEVILTVPDDVTVELVSADPGITFLDSPPRLVIDVLAPGTYPVTLQVSDGIQTIEVTIEVKVAYGYNLPPVFAMDTTEVALTGGDNFTLPIEVSDPNFDSVDLSVAGPAGMVILVGPTLSWTPPFRGAGVTTATITAFDGTASSTHVIQFTVTDKPNQAPVLPTYTGMEIGQGGVFVWDFDATDSEGDAFAYTVETTTAGVTGLTIDTGGLVNWSVPESFPQGNVWLTVRVEDVLGAINAVTYPVSVLLNQSPVFEPGSIPVAHRTDAWAHPFEITDPDDGVGSTTLFVELVTAPTGMGMTSSEGTYTLTWTPLTADSVGSHPIGFKVTDRWGVVTYFSSSVSIENRPPIIQATMPIQDTACLGRPQMFDISATDPDGDAVIFTAPGSSDVTFFGDPVTGGKFQFTDYTRQPFNNTITLQAADMHSGVESTNKIYTNVYGWRTDPSVPNVIVPNIIGSPSVGMAPVSAASNTNGDFVLAWKEGNDIVSAMRVDKDGCPVWGPNEVSFGDDKTFTGRIAVNQGYLWVSWGSKELTPLGATCTDSHSHILATVRISDGALSSRVCVDSGYYATSSLYGYTGSAGPYIIRNESFDHTVKLASQVSGTPSAGSQLYSGGDYTLDVAVGGNGTLYRVWGSGTSYSISANGNQKGAGGTSSRPKLAALNDYGLFFHYGYVYKLTPSSDSQTLLGSGVSHVDLAYADPTSSVAFIYFYDTGTGVPYVSGVAGGTATRFWNTEVTDGGIVSMSITGGNHLAYIVNTGTGPYRARFLNAITGAKLNSLWPVFEATGDETFIKIVPHGDAIVSAWDYVDSTKRHIVLMRTEPDGTSR